jgi:hypothetical protein
LPSISSSTSQSCCSQIHNKRLTQGINMVATLCYA